MTLLPPRIGAFLDIGTGTGRLLELVAPRAERAFGVDASRDMLALARARLAERGLADRCAVRQADMYRLPLPDAPSTWSRLQMVLHYAEDPAAALAEAARVLRPGGLLLVADLAPHERAELLERARASLAGLRRCGARRLARRGRLRAAAARPPSQVTLAVRIWPARRLPGRVAAPAALTF